MKHNFQKVRNPLQSILERYNLHETYIQNLLMNNWAEIIDKSLFDVIKPVSFENGILVLNVLNSAWIDELIIQKSILLKKINSKLNGYNLDDIKFIVN